MTEHELVLAGKVAGEWSATCSCGWTSTAASEADAERAWEAHRG